MWKHISKIPIKHPFLFGLGISTVKTSASDLLVQSVVERRPLSEIDWKRNAAFATFGCFYLGGVQYALYVPIFGRIFPNAASFAAKPLRDKIKDIRGIGALCGQVFLDQMVHHPFLYFPVFYATREFVMVEKPDLSRCLNTYRENMKEDLLALWKIWVPSTFVNFAFMPMWARIPWGAATSLIWTCILSAMRGGDSLHVEDLEAPFPTGTTFSMIKEEIDDIFSSPVDLDKNKAHLCISGAGPDQIGYVALMARTIADAGGSVTHSKMVRLGQEFTTLMHVSIEKDKQQDLIRSLRNNKELKPMNVRASALKRRHTGSFKDSILGFRLHVVGADRPGMLASIAEFVAQRNMSIEDVSTQIRIRKEDKQRVFVTNMDVVTANHMSQEQLDNFLADFDKLKKELELSVVDIRMSHRFDDVEEYLGTSVNSNSASMQGE